MWYCHSGLLPREIISQPSSSSGGPQRSWAQSSEAVGQCMQVNNLDLFPLQMCDVFGWTECPATSTCSCSFNFLGFFCLW